MLSDSGAGIDDSVIVSLALEGGARGSIVTVILEYVGVAALCTLAHTL